MYMDDARLKLTQEQHCALARMVENGQALPKKAGRRGFCALIRALAYTDYADRFVVPVAHALLLSLVKDFLERPAQEGVGGCDPMRVVPFVPVNMCLVQQHGRVVRT